MSNLMPLKSCCHIELSSIDKKSKPNEKEIKLCNFTNVYYNWNIYSKMVDGFMTATASDNNIKLLSLKKGDVVITKDSETRDDIGMSAYVYDDLPNTVLGYHCALIRPSSLLDGAYLNAYLNSRLGRKYFENQASGSGQRYTLAKESIGSIKIPVLPIKTQEKIGAIFNNIDLKIRNNTKSIAELESLAKTLYDYWFLQFEFPNEEGKPYKSSGGKMVWNDELKREIPEGWKVKKIKDCIEHINTGLNPRDHFLLNQGGDIKYITVKNLTTKGTIDFSGCDKITEEVKEIINKRSMIEKGDILFASIAPLGRCFLIQETPKDWEINESVFSIRPCIKVISSEYLYMFLMSDWFIKKSEHASTGSVFNGIRISTLNDTNVLIPSKSILNKFGNVINPIYKNKFNSEKESQQLIELRDFLLPMLMNGQVTFKDESTI